MRRTRLLWCATLQPPAAAASAADKLLWDLRARDITLRASLKNAAARLVYASTAKLLGETVRRHKLHEFDRPLLGLIGTHLSFTNMLAALQEGEERVAVRFTTGDITITTESLALGECRCCVVGRRCEASESSAQLPLRVDRFLYGRSLPFSSVTAAPLQKFLTHEESYSDAPVCACKPVGLPVETLSSGLCFGGLPPDVVTSFYHHNITLHGCNFFHQSEGANVALWCDSHLDDFSTLTGVAPCSGDSLPNESPSEDENVNPFMGGRVHSFGVLVLPVAAGSELEAKINRLQYLLLSRCIARHKVFDELTQRATQYGLSCQDSIALVTGDYEGAYKVAAAARQFTQDPSVAAPVIEKARRELGLDGDCYFPIDHETVVRNGLDYFCRCSKGDFLHAAAAIPKEQLKSLMHETSFRCTFCGKEHELHQEDWNKILSN
uniref:Uncharacterized protein n=1 Tax=Trypanosoma congolense (strain IL3000) TaxID=1068625 RepID=G0UNL1_TRYCI|nr:conserved hypothetical protein [Trypanosoma congolense IL3000]